MSRPDDARAALLQRRAELDARLASLAADERSILRDRSDATADDEHDPRGRRCRGSGSGSMRSAAPFLASVQSSRPHCGGWMSADTGSACAAVAISRPRAWPPARPRRRVSPAPPERHVPLRRDLSASADVSRRRGTRAHRYSAASGSGSGAAACRGAAVVGTRRRNSTAESTAPTTKNPAPHQYAAA